MRQWILAVWLFALCLPGFAQDVPVRSDLDAFNRAFTSAVLSMDNARVMSLWADDGVTLLPGMAPLSGKVRIATWLDGVTARMRGYKVVRQEDKFQPVSLCGEWASEWATTLQVVQPPGGKPPIETHGKMLLVLHRDKTGGWRIASEMWNASPAPQ